MVSRTYGAVKDEQTALIMPSPNSTEHPVRSTIYTSYSQLEMHDADSEEDAELQLKDFPGETYFRRSESRILTRCKRSYICKFFCFGVLVISSLGFISAVFRMRSSRAGVQKHTEFKRKPLSNLDPVKDLGLFNFDRPDDSKPPAVMQKLTETRTNQALPTNSWYQNMLRLSGEPTEDHRAYSMPYIVDAAGPIPGVRLHPAHVDASTSVIQLSVVTNYGLTVGAATADGKLDDLASKAYTVDHISPLGLTIGWDDFHMKSTITKGMPYATMVYDDIRLGGDSEHPILPTIASQVPLAADPIVDGKKSMECHEGSSKEIVVEAELELAFESSDFTWLVFFSEPVKVRCLNNTDQLTLQVTDWASNPRDQRSFVARITVLNPCTSGLNPIYCHVEQMHPTALYLGQGDYGDLLRNHSRVYPGPQPTVDYVVNHTTGTILTSFDWDKHEFAGSVIDQGESKPSDLLTFALPHHLDTLMPTTTSATKDVLYCAPSLTGPACLVLGSIWTLKDAIPAIDFTAPRRPTASSFAAIAASLKSDMSYSLPEYFEKGAGDTYFSGKLLAKLGRILLIAQELHEICSNEAEGGAIEEEYEVACQQIQLPPQEQMAATLEKLKESVEIWINGSAVAPFVFDAAWGGVVNCGCLFDDATQTCQNKFPDCPAFSIHGLNFGNGFYNDMHFHYGYHIYAAAIISRFDHVWGRKFFERVLLLIRNIANPTEEDKWFPIARHKDWFNGHSWASGIDVTPPNGRNQESSSEAIAAYEAVALYGQVMMVAWEGFSSELEAVSKEVRDIGIVLTAGELRSARRYWHVHRDGLTTKVYPSEYSSAVIGIMWQTMAQFQTWFGSAAYLAYGIQLLPLTPIAEERDQLDWVAEMYQPFADSCNQSPECEATGWSIPQLAMLATVGYPEIAIDRAIGIPSSAFTSPGGNGHSLSNTLWFISTRPHVKSPVPLQGLNTKPEKKTTDEADEEYRIVDCYQPDSCSNYVLDTIVGVYTCRQRMDWLIRTYGKTQREACTEVAGVEFTKECGPCNPEGIPDAESKPKATVCPPCNEEICDSELNRCPAFTATYLCTGGVSRGGCARFPWDISDGICTSCCEVTSCAQLLQSKSLEELEKNCPPCPNDICEDELRHGSSVKIDDTPYLCMKGNAQGGCASHPWSTAGGQCEKCCKLSIPC